MSQFSPLPAVSKSKKSSPRSEKESIVHSFPITSKLTTVTVVKKRRRKRQDPQACPAEFQNEDFVGDDSSPMSSSDVEAFQGKIVYNLDANSAYIIDNSDNDPNSTISDHSRSLRSTSRNTTRKLKTIDDKDDCGEVENFEVDCKTTQVAVANSELNVIPFRTPTPKITPISSNPRIHSFRVVSAHDAFASAEQREPGETTIFKKIQKPILMCFICKLSFGNTKSFSLHANAEHSLNLQDLEIERSLLKREYSSAIIQRNMDEKPQISFLEPLGEEGQDNENDELERRYEHLIQSNLEETHRHVDNQNISSQTTSEINCAVKMDKSTKLSESIGLNTSENSIIFATTSLSPGTKAKDVSNETLTLESENNFNSPKRNASSDPITESEKMDTNEVVIAKPDNNDTDNLSGNTSAISRSNSNKSFNAIDDINCKNEKSLSCHSPISEIVPRSLSTNVADFLQKQIQQLTSPLRNVHPTSPPSLIQPLAITTSGSGNISPFSLPLASTTTLATTANSSKPHDSSHQAYSVLSGDQSCGGVQFLNELLLQHQLAFHQQQLQIQSQQLSCPDHPDCKVNDCKTCDAQQQSKHSQQQQNRLSLQIPTSASMSVSNNGNNNSVSAITTTSNISSVSPTAVSAISGTSINSNASIVSVAPSFTIGACSEHINGRPLGIDCVRCEMLLNSARLNSGVQISSTRNSCKTLKCPQCNWHYKYQETLEIHMREKHPDGESACGYCLAGQQHPRLARGESYSCGYKPYRCEICNYSTTTKGNLSIHMQSDKHLNNMQELNNSQNMVAAAAAAAAVAAVANNSGTKISSEGNITPGTSTKSVLQQSSNGAGSHNTMQQCASGSNTVIGNQGGTTSNVNTNKPRPSFRCDICSYETSVARNLRIHMTSEKHTHNMAVLQNNIKHIQAFSYLQQQHQQASAAAAAAAASSNISGQTQSNTGSGNGVSSGGNSPFMPEVALADMAYNQALMIQLQLQLQQNVAVAAVAQQQQIMCKSPNKTSPTSPNHPQSPQNQSEPFSPRSKSPTMMFADLNGSELCMSSAPAIGDQTAEGDLTAYGTPDLFPCTLYSCVVCAVFNTNSLDELQQHLLLDRSRSTSSTNDIMLIHNNNYICRLCNYKTNLKANFQLHSKTDKHLQKLNFINHIREGGIRNEYKLKFQQQQQFASNTVQIKCNCCDFYTNSIQKLSLHVQHMRHETMRAVFQHLRYILIKQGNDKSFLSAPGTKHSTQASGNNVASSETASDSLEKQTNASRTNDSSRALLCQLCNYSTGSLLDMVRHAKSLRHLQIEQFICLQRRSENLEGPALVDIFKISQYEQQVPEETAMAMTTVDCSDEDSSKMKCGGTISSSAVSGVSSLPTSTLRSLAIDDILTAHVAGGTIFENPYSPASNSSLVSNISGNYKKQPFSLDIDSGMFTSIFKCNICEFIAQTKNELESHHEQSHSNTNLDFINIPTNTAALQAFQAAVAAAAAAAAAAATSRFTEKSSPTTFILPEEDDCPVAVKKERLDVDEEEMEEDQAKDKQSRDSTEVRRDCVSSSISNRTQFESSEKNIKEQDVNTKVQCPLCQEAFTEKHIFELHLMKVHSVSQDGLLRLLQLVDNSNWKSLSISAISASELGNDDYSSDDKVTANVDTKHEYLCRQCHLTFENGHLLLQHAQNTQHFTVRDNGDYLCLSGNLGQRSCSLTFATLPALIAHYRSTHILSNESSSNTSNLVISERHVYKYRCKQCSLAFKTEAKLNTHALYHTMRDATKCNQCQRNFRSTQALQKHVEQSHTNIRQLSESSHLLEDVNKDITISPSDVTIDSNEIPQKAEQSCQSTDLQIVGDQDRGIVSVSHQQQQVAALTAALIKQQQHYSSINLDDNINTPSVQSSSIEILQKLQMEKKNNQATEEQQQMAYFSNLQSLQNLQSIQNFQQIQHHMPQLAAAAAASNLHMNPVDMLNLMQFHHLMSLNFMNLAPPLIFGGNTTTSMVTANTSSVPPRSSSSNHILATSSTDTVNLQSTNTATSSSSISSLECSSQLLQQPSKQQQTSPGIAAAQLSANQKRARTRITDEQLKILRAHFDINNSPSEESIMEMSEKANLPMKVVKHWFRNTLFKERQRNKDSPYNFNNPPSTTLNLEEYERTGQTKVTPLNESSLAISNTSSTESTKNSTKSQCGRTSPTTKTSSDSIANLISAQMGNQVASQSMKNLRECSEHSQECSPENTSSSQMDFLNLEIKSEPNDEIGTKSHHSDIEKDTQEDQQLALTSLKKHQQRFSEILIDRENEQEQVHDQHHNHLRPPVGTSPAILSQVQTAMQHSFYSSYETKSESGSSDILSRPQTPNSTSALSTHPFPSINDLLSQQLDNMPMNNTSSTSVGTSSQMGPPKNFQLNPSGSGVNKIITNANAFEKNCPSSAQFDTNSNSSTGSSTSSGKRANRTRFTDYQIKVLQEFFENNSYPKDSDLEYLSKLLLLSPRVIVVWFQNARQKQRKIYENQPNNSLYESEEKKQNINYACKKCNLVFQRYYELIRHQKNHCFKEENNKKSAKAQIAAAQIAQNLSSEDSNSSMDISQQHAVAVAAALASSTAVTVSGAVSSSIATNSGFNIITTSPQHPLFGKSTSSLADPFSPSTTPTPPSQQRERSNSTEHRHLQTSPIKLTKYECDKCKLSFSQIDHLREHQLLHIVNPGLFSINPSVQPPHAQTQIILDASGNAYGPFGSILQNLQQAAQQHISKKRKYSETSSNADDLSSTGGISSSTGDMETQTKKYEFLYQYFIQNENDTEIKQRFQSQQQLHTNDLEMDMEFLMNFYQQCEVKKRNNYEFLLQYYLKNEQQQQLPSAAIIDGETKPNFEFLLQFYQLNESKKFFQLEASPQPILDPDENFRNLKKLKFQDTEESLKASEDHLNICNRNNFFKLSDTSTTNPILISSCDDKTQKPFCNNSTTDTSKKLQNSAGCEEGDYSSNDDCCEEEKIRGENKKLVQPIFNNNNKESLILQHRSHADKSPSNFTPSSNDNGGVFYQNLEDFLDATMIENNSQPLKFNESLQKQQQQPLAIESSMSLEANVNQSVSTGQEKNKIANITTCENKQNKRLRTTILPDQLNFLYECYQNESNPSRKMLEEISKKVNLKKRVVQVWFQNARAKDKKSRNQRFVPAISDDSNTILKSVPPSNDMSETKLADCNSCKLSDINIQHHSISIDHIQRVKELLLNQKGSITSNNEGKVGDLNNGDNAGITDRDNKFERDHWDMNCEKMDNLLSLDAIESITTDNDRRLFLNSTINFNATDTKTAESEQDKKIQSASGDKVRNDIIQQMFNYNKIAGKFPKESISFVVL